ncbi:response regulator transcription factor [Falsirhodobacter xinxiangensis]|uniref:response regulator transcription factor n=1 Tax=Falsirhodobacter xinxiangensis TaxID=2530049 RepID=UPI0010AA7A44|nr:response regulator transcription factor [Rhodobacter xinxiangensis]
MDILIVEDDAGIAEFLKKGLEVEGYTPHRVSSFVEMRAAMADRAWPLVILDRMLPDGEGAEICADLRSKDAGVLILMLTARDTLEEKLEGLRAGADDYITKPFAFEELLARIETLLRRTGARQEEITIGDLTLDLSHKSARRAGRDLGLTPTEFALLRFLAERPGTIVNRMEILSGVWGKSFDPNTNLVEVYIAYLRKKVDGHSKIRLIRNVRGFGYVIEMS